MKKIIITGIVLMFSPIVTLAHTVTDEEEVVIRMTKNGFEPSEVTVTVGDHVTFINADTVDRWPASNLHPTHGIYPEFDPLEGIPPGDSWEMTFGKAGTWRMHDHLIPSMTGVITVLENIEAPNTNNQIDSSGEEKKIKLENQGFISNLKSALKAFFHKLGNIFS